MRSFTARALALASLVVLAVCTCDPAFAQTVAPVLQPSGVVAQTAVDWTPLIVIIRDVAVSVISLIGVPIALMAYNWFATKSGREAVELTEAQRAEADAVWRKVVGFAVQRTDGLTATMAATGAFTTDIKSDFVRHALDYGIQHFPDVLKRAKVLDSRGNPDEAQLERILDARLGMLSVSQATAPQTLATATAAEPPTVKT